VSSCNLRTGTHSSTLDETCLNDLPFLKQWFGTEVFSFLRYSRQSQTYVDGFELISGTLDTSGQTFGLRRYSSDSLCLSAY